MDLLAIDGISIGSVDGLSLSPSPSSLSLSLSLSISLLSQAPRLRLAQERAPSFVSAQFLCGGGMPPTFAEKALELTPRRVVGATFFRLWICVRHAILSYMSLAVTGFAACVTWWSLAILHGAQTNIAPQTLTYDNGSSRIFSGNTLTSPSGMSSGSVKAWNCGYLSGNPSRHGQGMLSMKDFVRRGANQSCMSKTDHPSLHLTKSGKPWKGHMIRPWLSSWKGCQRKSCRTDDDSSEWHSSRLLTMPIISCDKYCLGTSMRNGKEPASWKDWMGKAQKDCQLNWGTMV